MSHRKAFLRYPTDEERSVINELARGEGSPREFFASEQQHIDKMLITRDRIIGAFVRTVDPATGRHAYGNYITNVGADIVQLMRYMTGRMGDIDELIAPGDIAQYRHLVPLWSQRVRVALRAALIEENLQIMQDTGELWRIGDLWEVAQSVADEYTQRRQWLRDKNSQLFLDERAHHGRPSKQSRRRDSQLEQAPGASISNARYMTA